MIEIISATRLSEQEFWSRSALGLSLRRLSRDTRLVPHIAFANTRGLPDVFNARITASTPHDVLVFVHDDVWIDDFFLAARLFEGLDRFDVVGVAGNRRRLPRQPAWAFIGRAPNGGFMWDERAWLSGVVAHGAKPFGSLSHFGVTPVACELLDGVFLAARRSRLAQAGVAFDSRFDFHFYDLDFCRMARSRGLNLGTWPIAMTHQSGGSFGSEGWMRKYHEYVEKWGD